MKRTIILVMLAIPICMHAQKKGGEPINDQDNPLRTQTIAEDLVVQGSECIGVDCLTTESFGSDTQRYKENNLRIHFDDTSDPKGVFSSNDWRIEINSISTGGDGYFSINDVTGATVPFLIEAGAGSNTLYVSDSENVGFGTNNPVVNLHVAEGNSPTLRLEQDASNGFTPQTWDIAGNEANFFVRNVTNSSALPFRIYPTAEEDNLVLRNDKVGIGEVNPLESLHIKTTGDEAPSILLDSPSIDWSMGIDPLQLTEFRLADLSLGTVPMVITSGAPDDSFLMDQNGNIGLGTDNPLHKLHVQGDIAKTGSIVGVSDQRIKTNISSVTGALTIINALDGKKYDFKTEEYPTMNLPEGTQYGLIAQDVEKVLEDLVRKKFMQTTNEDGETILLNGVNYEQIIPILINAIKEQDKTIQKLTKNAQDTEARLAALEAKLIE